MIKVATYFVSIMAEKLYAISLAILRLYISTVIEMDFEEKCYYKALG